MPSRGDQFAAAAEACLVVAELDVAFDRVEERRRQRHEAVARIAFDHGAHVRVDAENLLDHHQRAARARRRAAQPAADLADVRNFDVDLLAHAAISGGDGGRF